MHALRVQDYGQQVAPWLATNTATIARTITESSRKTISKAKKSGGKPDRPPECVYYDKDMKPHWRTQAPHTDDWETEQRKGRLTSKP